MKIEQLEELKNETKSFIIQNHGEEGYYKMIGEKLKHLVELKENGNMLFPEMTEEEQKIQFKKSVIQSIVNKYSEKEEEMLLQIGLLEIAFDTFEF